MSCKTVKLYCFLSAVCVPSYSVMCVLLAFLVNSLMKYVCFSVMLLKSASDTTYYVHSIILIFIALSKDHQSGMQTSDINFCSLFTVLQRSMYAWSDQHNYRTFILNHGEIIMMTFLYLLVIY